MVEIFGPDSARPISQGKTSKHVLIILIINTQGAKKEM